MGRLLMTMASLMVWIIHFLINHQKFNNMGFLSVFGSVMIARGIGSFIQKINTRIFPFEGSSDEAKALYQAKLNNQQQEINQEFQLQLREKDFLDKKELAYIQGMIARQTTFMSNIQSCQNTMRNRLFEDALKNFPLNIPPLIMLQNAGIPVNSITDKVIGDDPFMQSVKNMLDRKSISDDIIETFKRQMQANPVALSVFVTPLQVDSRAEKDRIPAFVWASVYQKVESIFISEYNRGGERPVIFYPSAWNVNAKPGMHASEILYFFTKGMPVVVIEPRYDGKQMRFMFSCWGIGMTGDSHIRQEITFDLDWNDIIIPAVYERSKQRLESLSKIEKLPPDLMLLKKRMEHNVSMYESLEKVNGLKSNGICDDPSKLFMLSGDDYSEIADLLSCSLGMVLSSLSDVHHMLARGITPVFPEIKEKYFGSLYDRLGNEECEQLNETFAHLFKSANAELFLNGVSSVEDFEDQNTGIGQQFEVKERSNSFDLQNKGLFGMLKQENQHHESEER